MRCLRQISAGGPVNDYPDCYGTMIPDLTRLKLKERLEGQASIAQAVSSGRGHK
jgi:hypothetical protein